MPTSEELKDQQRRQWAGNAAGWDSQHERLEREMRLVSEWLLREAHIEPGMRVLDLACGSGHPSLDEARIVRPGGSVVATDLVAEMVAITERRAREAGLDNLEARVMDAEAIEFPDGSFDAVTCRFGIMFCPEPGRAMAEARRVLKQGGRFALSVWDEPSKSPAQTVSGEALRRFGRPPPAADLGVPGMHRLAPPGELDSLLGAAGFREVLVEPLSLAFEYESLEALWERQMVRPGPQRALAQELSTEELRRLKATLLEVVQPYTRQGMIRLPASALCAVAQK